MMLGANSDAATEVRAYVLETLRGVPVPPPIRHVS